MTVTYGGSVGSRDLRQASVIEGVPFGLMRRTLILRAEEPVMLGSSEDMTANVVTTPKVKFKLFPSRSWYEKLIYRGFGKRAQLKG